MTTQTASAIEFFAPTYDKVDNYLEVLTGRTMVSVAEVQDLLLDIRLDLDRLRDFAAN